METLLIILLIVAVAVILGWLSVRSTRGKLTIDIDKSEIKEDTRKAVDKTQDAFRKGKQKWSQTTHESGEQSEPAEKRQDGDSQ